MNLIKSKSIHIGIKYFYFNTVLSIHQNPQKSYLVFYNNIKQHKCFKHWK